MIKKRLSIFMTIVLILQLLCPVNLTFASVYTPLDEKFQLAGSDVNAQVYFVDNAHKKLTDDKLKNVSWNDAITFRCDFKFNPDLLRAKYEAIPGVTTRSAYAPTGQAATTGAILTTTTAVLYCDLKIPAIINLPDSTSLPLICTVDGSSVTLGTCHINKDTHIITLQFNANVLYESWSGEIAGYFEIGGQFNQAEVGNRGGGHQTIVFTDGFNLPVGSQAVDFLSKEAMESKLAGTATLTKHGEIVLNDAGKDYIKWTLNVTPTTDIFSKGLIVDKITGKIAEPGIVCNSSDFGDLVNGLTFDPSSVEMKSQTRTFTKGPDRDDNYQLDYSSSSPSSFTFNLPKLDKNTDKVLTITYKTFIDEKALLDIKNTFHASATLYKISTANPLTVIPDVTTSASMNWISKSFDSHFITDTANKKVIVDWTILVNPMERSLQEAHVFDTLQSGLEYVPNSVSIKDLTTSTNVTPSTVSISDVKDANNKSCEELDFNLESTNPNHKYEIKFKTSIDSSFNQTVFYNTPILKTDSFTITGEKTTLGVATSSIAKSGTWDPQTHTIKWTINVNTSKYPLEKDCIIEDIVERDDTTESGIKYSAQTYVENSLTYPTDLFDLEWSEESGHKKFILKSKEAFSSSPIITYKTKLKDDDPSVWGNNTSNYTTTPCVLDVVSLSNSGVKPASSTSRIKTPSEVISKQASKFNYATRRITWTVKLNANKMEILNAKFIDALGEHQTYDFDSIKVYQNGSSTNIYDPAKLHKYSNDTVLSYDLGDISTGQYYTIVYDTIVKNDLFKESKTFKVYNNAYITGDTIYKGTTLPFELGKGVGTQAYCDIPYETIVKKSLNDKTNAYATWIIYVNPLNAPFGEDRIIVKDQLHSMLKLDLSSVKLYKLKVDPNFGLSVDYSSPIAVNPADISYDDTNTFTYTLPATISNGTECYALEFGTDIVRISSDTEIKNSASFSNSTNGGSSQNTKEDAKVKFSLSYSAAGIGATRGATLCVTKVDSISGNGVAGAVFECYYTWNGTEILKATGTSDTNGNVYFYGLSIGTTYSIKEKTAPSGYLLSNEVLEVTPTLDDKGKTISRTFKNAPLNQCYTATLTKTDASLSSLKLKDAVYDLYYTSVSPARLIDTYTTDSNGQIQTDKLPPGNYEWRETVAPAGYKLATEPISFTINSGNVSSTTTNERKTASIKLTKTGKYSIQSDSEAQPLSGVVFKLFRTSPGPEIQIGETYTTDSNGEIKIPDLIWGNYYLQEVEVPTGYISSTQKHPFIITKDETATDTPFTKEVSITNIKSSGTVHIIKTDADTNEPLANVEFTLSIASNASAPYSVHDTYTTDSDGKIDISNLPWGFYKLSETRAKEGYIANSTETPFEINATNVTVPQNFEFKNTKQKGTAKLTKYITNTSIPLKGAQYELYNTSTNPATLVREEPYITNEDGEIITGILPPGDYEWREKLAPAGYKVDKTPIPFKLYNSQVTKSAYNSHLTKAVSLLKFDNTSNQPLKDTTFKLVKCDATSEVTIGNYTTDANGLIRVTNLDWGNYYFEEVKVPAGYTLSSVKKSFSVTKENVQDPNPIELTFGNTRKLGSATIIEKDSATNELLSGVQFTLYKDGLLYNTYETVNGKIEISNLPWGSYHLKETQPKTGYILSTKDYSFEVTAETIKTPKLFEITNTRKTGEVKLLKVDSSTNKPLAGAKIGFYDTDNNCLQTFVTNEHGTISVSNLNWGHYYFKEIQPPSGYQLSTISLPISITPDNVSSVQEVKLENTICSPPFEPSIVPDNPDDIPNSSIPDSSDDSPDSSIPNNSGDSPDSSIPDSSDDSPDGSIPNSSNNNLDSSIPGNLAEVPDGQLNPSDSVLPPTDSNTTINGTNNHTTGSQNSSTKTANGIDSRTNTASGNSTNTASEKSTNTASGNNVNLNNMLPRTGGIVDARALTSIGILLFAIGEYLRRRKKNH